MADGEARLIVTLIDKASAGINSLKSRIADLSKSWLAIGAAVGAATAFIAESIKAFAEQEQAIAKLDNALRNQGITARNVKDDIVAYASELQRTTTFSDETIIANQALLVSFGLVGDQLKSATKASLDLSVGMGTDLRTATLMVEKAFQGQTTALCRLGIEIRDNIPA